MKRIHCTTTFLSKSLAFCKYIVFAKCIEVRGYIKIRWLLIGLQGPSFSYRFVPLKKSWLSESTQIKKSEHTCISYGENGLWPAIVFLGLYKNAHKVLYRKFTKPVITGHMSPNIFICALKLLYFCSFQSILDMVLYNINLLKCIAIDETSSKQIN